ncbi:hypothetical protein BH10ACI1_BH10ACI1_09560 [soil metagenome]
MRNTITQEKEMEITITSIPITKEFKKDFDNFCVELGFKQERRDLLKALLKFSGGQIIFESCLGDLANYLFKKEKANCKFRNLKCRVRERFKSLNEWQERNSVELIRILETNPDGRDVGKYKPDIIRYEFIFLSEWLKTSFENPNETINKNLQKLFEKYKKAIAIKAI